MLFKSKLHQGAFPRIGDRYGHFFNFDHFLGRSAMDDTWLAPHQPKTHAKENEEVYDMELALPGFHRKNISIEVEGDILIIKARKKEDKKSQWPIYVRREYSLPSLALSFQLPAVVDADKIIARYQNGILKLQLPHKEQLLKPQNSKLAVT